MADDNTTPSIQGEDTKPKRGKRVKTANGTEPGTDSSMVKFRFSGSPTSLFELTPEAGDTFVMTCTVQCTNGTHRKLGADGTFLEASFAVREVVIGRQTTLRDKGQTAVDDDEIAKESKEAESQLTLVPPAEADAAEAEQANAEQKAVSGVDDPFNPTTQA
ncbi:hypothetical protein SEA_APUNK_53 [Gordonia phage APunk]|uniref:Uncharacterized protein n=1 Tax=Gordonia phage APunk TaxID=2926082 RepID=A0A976U9R1_9CAUD|nr:hypothetical protein SEA_APUNK_53 [Gordonia phage APunk]